MFIIRAEKLKAFGHFAGFKLHFMISSFANAILIGLLAPECSDNPLGYKFSWSSRGCLLALHNSTFFYQEGSVINVAGPDLMATVPNISRLRVRSISQ